jgi:hypothetical protein
MVPPDGRWCHLSQLNEPDKQNVGVQNKNAWHHFLLLTVKLCTRTCHGHLLSIKLLGQPCCKHTSPHKTAVTPTPPDRNSCSGSLDRNLCSACLAGNNCSGHLARNCCSNYLARNHRSDFLTRNHSCSEELLQWPLARNHYRSRLAWNHCSDHLAGKPPQ